MNKNVLPVVFALVFFAGCHTSASFILPPNTDLIIYGKRVDMQLRDQYGRVRYERRPFFWTSVPGIDYILLQDEKVIKKDRLPSGFRISSIFWPPYAYLYWPIGFRFKCYDLSNLNKEFIEECAVSEEPEKRQPSQSLQGTP